MQNFKMNTPIIVLEGLDACGKSTQSELLIQGLESKNLRVGFLRFPGYDRNPAGARIAAYLRGELGGLESVDPRQIASLYAADRIFHLEIVEKMRAESDIVIFDRGVSSNLIYTPARAEKPAEIAELRDFVENLEYEVFGFPRESLVIFLDASRETRARIHAAKNRLADLHESDGEYLERVRKIALEKCESDFRWIRVSVDRAGDLRRREEISGELLNLVLEKLQKSK